MSKKLEDISKIKKIAADLEDEENFDPREIEQMEEDAGLPIPKEERWHEKDDTDDDDYFDDDDDTSDEDLEEEEPKKEKKPEEDKEQVGEVIVLNDDEDDEDDTSDEDLEEETEPIVDPAKDAAAAENRGALLIDQVSKTDLSKADVEILDNITSLLGVTAATEKGVEDYTVTHGEEPTEEEEATIRDRASAMVEETPVEDLDIDFEYHILQAIEAIEDAFEGIPPVPRVEIGVPKIDSEINEAGINVSHPDNSTIKAGDLVALYPYRIAPHKPIKPLVEAMAPIYEELNQKLATSRERLKETVGKEMKPIYAYVVQSRSNAMRLMFFRRGGAAIQAASRMNLELLIKLIKSKAIRITKEVPLDVLAYGTTHRMGNKRKPAGTRPTPGSSGENISQDLFTPEDNTIRTLKTYMVLDSALFRKLRDFDS